ncbi:MAG: class I SAM-dependent methyltransferase [Dehalococcoidia bacterium]
MPVALAHRHALIDRWAADSDAVVVLELAAGLSPRGFWLSGLSERLVVEVDTPEVIAAKLRLLRGTAEGRAALTRTHWRFTGGDLRTLDLDTLVPPGQRTMVIAEGLLMYLDAEARRSLFRRIAELLTTRGGTFVADLVPPAEEPQPGLGGKLLGWLMRRATSGVGFTQGRSTRSDILAELLAAGFGSAEAVEPQAVAATLGLPHAGTWTRMVVFRARVP